MANLKVQMNQRSNYEEPHPVLKGNIHCPLVKSSSGIKIPDIHLLDKPMKETADSEIT